MIVYSWIWNHYTTIVYGPPVRLKRIPEIRYTTIMYVVTFGNRMRICEAVRLTKKGTTCQENKLENSGRKKAHDLQLPASHGPVLL